MDTKKKAFEAVNAAMDEWVKKPNPTTEGKVLEARRVVDILLGKEAMPKETVQRKAAVKVKTR